MLVQWTTASNSQCEVQWGSEPGRYQHSAKSKTMTYAREEMCGGAAKNVRYLTLLRVVYAAPRCASIAVARPK